ncbi:hypothetical protein D3C85_1278310 [compost metagenome]
MQGVPIQIGQGIGHRSLDRSLLRQTVRQQPPSHHRISRHDRIEEIEIFLEARPGRSLATQGFAEVRVHNPEQGVQLQAVDARIGIPFRRIRIALAQRIRLPGLDQ